MKYIVREIQKHIEKQFFKGKAIVIYGARQVGKTTLVKILQEKYNKALYINCDEIDMRQALQDKTSTELKSLFGNNNLIIIDEAQRVKNIGLTIKLIVDNYPELQIIATGSSSFELSGEIKEPLTGRKYEFFLYPFSYKELLQLYSKIEFKRLLELRIIYGMYPSIVDSNNVSELKLLADSYLYKDIFQYQNIKNSELLMRLLQALALQIGNEVSYNELASIVGVDKNTIISYINILEKAFIIFRLQPFSRNIRNELKKMRKIYFYDTGIRNALINNLNLLSLRQDAGALFENFMIAERIKFNSNSQLNKNYYCWRTHTQKEIDYLEEFNGVIKAFEFKFNKQALKFPQEFLDVYENSTIELINKDNFEGFLGEGGL